MVLATKKKAYRLGCLYADLYWCPVLGRYGVYKMGTKNKKPPH